MTRASASSGTKCNEPTRAVPCFTNMTRTCPDCGTAVDYTVRTASVLSGTCKQCGRAHTILQDTSATSPGIEHSGPEATGGPAEEGHGTGRTGIAASMVDGPTCAVCGSLLMFHASPGRGMDATCSGCGAHSAYILAEPESGGFRRMRAPQPNPVGQGSQGFPSSRARPCRECGGPLRFSTSPDGTISGECGSCGNRFTLPRRNDSEGGSRGRGGARFDRRSGPSFGRGGGPRSYGRPPPGRFRRRESDPDRDGDDRRRRRSRQE